MDVSIQNARKRSKGVPTVRLKEIAPLCLREKHKEGLLLTTRKLQ